MSNQRRFQDLTIRDNFMFNAVMVKDDNCKKFLEMLLGISIKKIVVSKEKEIDYNPDYKGVRLDVYANDENNTRYDIEMQVAKQELGKRIRYYHSQMDMELLEKGKKYKELPTAYVIFICDFDPFKRGKYCYTFENRCVEDATLKLEDESISIILSTEGKNVDCIPEGLKNFLSFVKEDNADNNSETKDGYVRQLQNSIRSLKENREVENNYMKWAWEAFKQDREDEIREEAKRESVLDILNELGEIPKGLEERIMSETRLDVLKSMVKIAAHATSFLEFEEKISKL